MRPPVSGTWAASSRMSCQLARAFTAKCLSKLSRVVLRIPDFADSQCANIRAEVGRPRPFVTLSNISPAELGCSKSAGTSSTRPPIETSSSFRIGISFGRRPPRHSLVVGCPVCKREIPSVSRKLLCDSSPDACCSTYTGDQSYRLDHGCRLRVSVVNAQRCSSTRALNGPDTHRCVCSCSGYVLAGRCVLLRPARQQLAEKAASSYPPSKTQHTESVGRSV